VTFPSYSRSVGSCASWVAHRGGCAPSFPVLRQLARFGDGRDRQEISAVTFSTELTQYWGMERKRSVAALVRIGTSISLSVAFGGACTDSLTDANPVPLSATTSVESTRTTRVAAPDLEAQPPAIVELPPDDYPTVDPNDPVAVATALVMVLTNRRSDVSTSTWHDRWSRLVTPALAADLDGSGAHGAYLEEGRTGNVVAIGVVVGSARRGTSSDQCQVIVLADETVLVDGHPVDERNFVSWQIDVERSEVFGWRASRISFGTAS